MTVSEAIERSAVIYPSEADKSMLIPWLSEIETRICLELLGKECESITEEDGERLLSAPDVYAELYPLYLIMKRELACGDSERYSFFSSVFAAAYGDYANYVNRTKIINGATYIKTV